MNDKPRIPQPPRGFSRLLWRAPIWLYRLRFGWVFGRRFLLLTHTGRKSGLSRQAVIEIIRYDPQNNIYYVASGFGEKSDWFRNILKNPLVTIQVGRQQIKARAERLPPEAAEQELIDYARRHPAAFKNLARILGYQLAPGEAGVRILSQVIPIVAFYPQ